MLLANQCIKNGMCSAIDSFRHTIAVQQCTYIYMELYFWLGFDDALRALSVHGLAPEELFRCKIQVRIRPFSYSNMP